NPNDPSNDPPVAVDDAVATWINLPVNGNVLTNDSDPNGDSISLNIIPVSGPANGSVTVNPDGSFTYVPTHNYIGPDQFVYNICDDGVPSKCDTATVYIIVKTPGNEPPVARDDINNTLKDTPVSGDVLTNDSDPDGDNLTVNSSPL